MGLAFKENVPDLRNSKVADLVAALAARGHRLAVHDPLVDRHEAHHEYGIELLADLPQEPSDAVIMAVPHAAYQALPQERLAALLHEGGLFADIKNAFPGMDAVPGVRRWRI